jgi:gamma-glutamylcyclotransferase (GGCT)/AIG2-like uncharacterized protein YtfP
MSEYLFTYGTLKPGHAPDEIAPAIGKLTPIGTGFVHGLLYDLGDYPGAVLDPTSQRRISGTIFKLSGDPSVLEQLDEYEGFDPKAPKSSLFVRTLHSLALPSGQALKCWIYVYNRRPEPERILESGIFTRNAI